MKDAKAFGPTIDWLVSNGRQAGSTLPDEKVNISKD